MVEQRRSEALASKFGHAIHKSLQDDLSLDKCTTKKCGDINYCRSSPSVSV